MTRVAASIMAAGLSTRFGGDKLRANLGGRRVIVWVLEAVRESKITRRSVVIRREKDIDIFSSMGFEILVNEKPEEGLSSSIKIAVEWLPDSYEGLLILLGDQPLVSSGTIERLVEEFMTGKYLIVSASVDDTPVNPAIFHRSLAGELKQLRGDTGARSVIQRHLDSTRLVKVDKRELLDVDTPEALLLAERYARELGRLK